MRKISTTIIVVLGLFVIVSLGTIGAITLTTASKAIEAESSERLEAVAEQKAAELESKLLNIESYIGSLNTVVEATIDLDTALSPTNNNYMTDYEKELDAFVSETVNALTSSYNAYIVFDPHKTNDLYQVIYYRDGNDIKALENTITKQELMIQSDLLAWFYLPIIKGKGIWSDPYYDIYLDQYIISYSEPIIIDGRTIGVIGTDILFDDFKTFITEITVYKTGYSFLLNSNHDILVHPTLETNSNMRTVNNGLYIPISNQIHFYEHGSQKYNFNGDVKIMGYDHLYNGWVIGIAPPLSEAFISLSETRLTFMIIFSVGIIIFLGLGNFIGRSLSKPIEQLVATVSHISEGYLDEAVDIKSYGKIYEIGLLATTIDKMRQSQKDVFQELLHHNESLDQKVSERTSELTSMNEELEAAVESLESAQLTIADMREQEAINDLIQHLAQKLSTPIANSITASSFLVKKAEDYKYGLPEDPAQEIGQSASIIFNSQELLQSIVSNLKQLSEDYKDEAPRHFPIKAHISHTIKNEFSILEKQPFDFKVDAEDQLMAFLPMDMTTKLVKILLSHSMNVDTQSNTSPKLFIRIRKLDDSVIIDYHDIIPWTTGIGERIFDPYYQMGATKGTSGLELYLLKHVVLKGFQGEIKAFETDDHQLAFHIQLPEYKEK